MVGGGQAREKEKEMNPCINIFNGTFEVCSGYFASAHLRLHVGLFGLMRTLFFMFSLTWNYNHLPLITSFLPLPHSTIPPPPEVTLLPGSLTSWLWAQCLTAT